MTKSGLMLLLLRQLTVGSRDRSVFLSQLGRGAEGIRCYRG